MNSPGQKPVTMLTCLTLTTLAAMIPDDFHVTICDENITPVDFETSADFIGITGSSVQWGRMKAIAEIFRKTGKTVLMGGPFASQTPEIVRPYCDILVRGEIENISDRLFSDLRESDWKHEYIGDWPDLSQSPVPRSDIYPNNRALTGCIQTSRGCPFQCEFCEITQYNGNKQRYKTVSQVLAELDNLYNHGFRNIFFCDDNFTANRNRAKEILAAICDWNAQHGQGKKVLFFTAVSIDAADDDELLELCAQAGILSVLVGIETTNKESLRETKKYQNLGENLLDRIQRFFNHGIMVSAGMILGFDSDNTDIFENQFQFAMSAPIPVFTLGPLFAPVRTPLYEKLKKQGRLADADYESVIQSPHRDTNIIPKQMTREQLLEGVDWLAHQLYHPKCFEERLLNLTRKIGRPRNPVAEQSEFIINNLRESVKQLRFYYRRLGTEEEEMLLSILKKVNNRSEIIVYVLSSLMAYVQIRYCIKHIETPR